MKVHEGARSNASIYESSSYMVLEFRKLKYNKEFKFFKLKLRMTFLIKIIYVNNFFIELEFHVKLDFLKLKF